MTDKPTLWDLAADQANALYDDRKPHQRSVLERDPISLEEGERLRDEGMERTLRNAEDWKAKFEEQVGLQLRMGRRRITSEDVTAVVGLPPGSRNRIGATMRACAVKFNLRNVGTVKSARTARHAGRVTVWERL